MDKILQAARELLKVLIDNFGPTGTVLLVAGALVVLFGIRVYKDKRTDKAIDRALAEKERSIQRLANQERTSRRIVLTQVLGLTPAEVDRLLQLEGDYADAEQSRKAVEGKKKTRE